MKSIHLPVRRAGFTLIELLTVIAIIGILAAIIIPTVAKVRENARALQCASRVRQWGAVFHLYASDNKGKYALRDGNHYWYQQADSASDTVYGAYMGGNRGDYSGFSDCPSQKTRDMTSTITRTCYLMGRPSETPGATPAGLGRNSMIDIQKIQTPSQFVMLTERSFDDDGNAVATNGSAYEAPYASGDSATQAHFQKFNRHGGKMHTVFADGSVRKIDNSTDLKNGWNGETGGRGSKVINYQRWFAYSQ